MSEVSKRAPRDAAPGSIARHGRLKRSAAWKSVLGFIGGTLAVVLVAGTSVAAIAVWQLQESIDNEEINRRRVY